MNPSAEQVQNNNGGEDGKDLNVLDSLPTGMVFAPTDDELIVHYLMRKIQNQPLPYVLDSLPTGMVFAPTDDELLVHYLMRKIQNQPLPYVLDSLPTGMVFAPTDDELIVHYLMRKIQNQPLPYQTDCIFPRSDKEQETQVESAAPVAVARKIGDQTQTDQARSVYSEKINPSAEQVQNNNGGEDGKDLNVLDSLPTGMVFAPTDDELIVHYLMRKIQNQPLPPNMIEVVNIYAFDPDQLPGKYKPLGRNEWFYFTPRERRYQKGSRPKRTAGDGHWKATGADKAVKFEDQTVGYRKALVYYRGEHKTNWIMHEYRAARPCPHPSRTGVHDKTFDDIVLCRIYYKGGIGEGSKRPRYEAPRKDEILQEQEPEQDLHPSMIYCKVGLAPVRG